MAFDDEEIQTFKDLIQVTLDEKLEEKLDVKLSHLPSKNEFYEEMAKLHKKLDDLTEEKDVLTSQVSRNTDRIDKLEVASKN